MSFFKNGNLIEQATNTATAGGITTLTVSSKSIQNFTGSADQTVRLPVATTLAVGQKYEILNSSTGILTIQYQDASSFSTATVSPNTSLTVRLTDNSTANGVWAKAASSGAGMGGSKNYLTTYLNNPGNGDLELGSTSGYSLGVIGTLTNGLPTGTPTFGSGASGNLSISTVASGQLAGSYSLSYASSAATTQGNMVATDAFNIDSEDQNKVLSWKFYYKAQTNPTNANWSGTSSNSFAVAMYDVTNSAWIPVAGQFGMTQSSGVGVCTGTFQVPYNTTSMRLVVYNANATSGAVTVYFDDFFVGPQTTNIGPVVTDWVSYSPTFTNISAGTTGSSQCQWRRVGDSMEITGRLTAGGSSIDITGDISVSLPAGYAIDITKLYQHEQSIGSAHLLASGNYRMNLGVIASSSTTNFAFIAPTTTTPTGNFLGTGIPQADASYWIANSVISWSVKVPISGWSSNVQMSNDTDTRVVAARMDTTTGTVLNGSGVKIDFNGVFLDTHGMASTANDRMTIPVSGVYKIRSLNFLSGTTGERAVRTDVKVNGATSYQVALAVKPVTTTGTSWTIYGEITLKLNAGDYVEIFGVDVAGTTTVISGSYFEIERLSGPATIAATETVCAIYQTSAGGSIGNSTDTFIDCGTKVVDTHNAVVGAGSGNNTTYTNTWRFIAPISGLYRCDFVFSVGIAGGNSLYLSSFIAKNGVDTHRGNTLYLLTAAVQTANYGSSGSGVIKCNAGDAISFAGFQENGAARTMVANPSLNRISITRVGN